MKKYEVALWENVTTWEDNGFTEDHKKLIGWFSSYQEAKRYLRDVLVPWTRKWEHESHEDWDDNGWFMGYVVPHEYARRWKVNAFRLQGDHKETAYAILRPLDK